MTQRFQEFLEQLGWDICWDIYNYNSDGFLFNLEHLQCFQESNQRLKGRCLFFCWGHFGVLFLGGSVTFTNCLRNCASDGSRWFISLGCHSWMACTMCLPFKGTVGIYAIRMLTSCYTFLGFYPGHNPKIPRWSWGSWWIFLSKDQCGKSVHQVGFFGLFDKNAWDAHS